MKLNSLLDICSVELEKNSNSISSIGINIIDNGMNVIFPRGYDLGNNERDLRKDILLLIKVLDKYRSRKEGKIFNNDKERLVSGKGSKFPIKIAIWLLSNYENNGIYNEYIHNYKVDKRGNTNWSRTIKTQIPYISNNNLVYTDFVVRKKNNDINNKVILIHKAVIESCINNMGWLYPHINIDRGNKLPFSKTICINILKKELSLSNLDSKKQLLKNMINFLRCTGDDIDNFKMEEYKTEYFMNIWEDMLNVVLGNENAENYYPNAQWNIIGKDSIDASSLRPDIILRDEKIVYVLDAKYYKYGVTGNVLDLPQSSDITKQMLYSSYIVSNRNIYGVDSAYDAFLIPYNGRGESVFKIVGNATVDIEEFKDKKVDCILVDIKSIMQSYVQGIDINKYRYQLKIIMNNN
ncbi:LlaJI family restriction endonuclease [Paraclostridium sordellii]|uniref:LlaJI family restriction endonuclease n=1 Tax=Paraclostridium sordellii TaxID=1505 RepID=UPI0005E1CA33|nr:LlaJI family restriction endonuclease [Paeniclostridium sordellii]CEP43692.1 restriction endonuclease [[Clostridium] sordellii] [Paeniclostridium sordellii]